MWTDAVTVRAVWIRRRPGPLLVPFDPPVLSLAAVIDRRWHLELRREDFPRCWLLLPDPVPERFLPTYPLRWSLVADVPGQEWFPHDPRPLIQTERVRPRPNYL